MALNPDPDGQIDLSGLDGELIGIITSISTMWRVSPVPGETQELPRTMEDFPDGSSLIEEALTAFRLAIARIDAGQTFVEMGSSRSPDGGFGTGPPTEFDNQDFAPPPAPPPRNDNGGGPGRRDTGDDANLDIDNQPEDGWCGTGSNAFRLGQRPCLSAVLSWRRLARAAARLSLKF
ncbi:hypothetical protein [Marinibacterium profundimaris]|uniref:Uncharacterized protein n=1 Tax=Marinibacterium profundimaris TaxID=1679460 RepID=A0A225NGL2_9RHOB|nr:hypothetical protein [Marinibacterium profundimaris]OWU72827.1 hypothetical protein ATO3_14045 [Marinibacterium profundimaris]